MTRSPSRQSIYPRSAFRAAVLAASALVALGAFNLSDAAAAGRGGGHAGGGGHASGGARGGGGYRGGGNRGYNGWGGGYYSAPPIVFGSPYYCAPPLVYGPYTQFGACEWP